MRVSLDCSTDSFRVYRGDAAEEILDRGDAYSCSRCRAYHIAPGLDFDWLDGIVEEVEERNLALSEEWARTRLARERAARAAEFKEGRFRVAVAPNTRVRASSLSERATAALSAC